MTFFNGISPGRTFIRDAKTSPRKVPAQVQIVEVVADIMRLPFVFERLNSVSKLWRCTLIIPNAEDRQSS